MNEAYQLENIDLKKELDEAIKTMKFGSITVLVQDGEIVELDITNKKRKKKSQGQVIPAQIKSIK